MYARDYITLYGHAVLYYRRQQRLSTIRFISGYKLKCACARSDRVMNNNRSGLRNLAGFIANSITLNRFDYNPMAPKCHVSYERPNCVFLRSSKLRGTKSKDARVIPITSVASTLFQRLVDDPGRGMPSLREASSRFPHVALLTYMPGRCSRISGHNVARSRPPRRAGSYRATDWRNKATSRGARRATYVCEIAIEMLNLIIQNFNLPVVHRRASLPRRKNGTRRGGDMDMHRDELLSLLARDNGDKTRAHTRAVIRELIKMLARKDFYRGSDAPLYNPAEK